MAFGCAQQESIALEARAFGLRGSPAGRGWTSADPPTPADPAVRTDLTLTQEDTGVGAWWVQVTFLFSKTISGKAAYASGKKPVVDSSAALHRTNRTRHRQAGLQQS